MSKLAFPQTVPDYIDHPVHGYIHRDQVGQPCSSGMTLREYFAAHAPITIQDAIKAAGFLGESLLGRDGEELDRIIEVLTSLRYDYADAMMKHAN